MSADVAQPSSEIFAHGVVRLILWRHAGGLVKKVGIVLGGQPLPKPYLGVPLSDEMVAFVALAGGHLSRKTVSLSVNDNSGAPIFHKEKAQVRSLGQLCKNLKDAEVCRKLLTGILRHAPTQTKGWTEEHSAAFAAALLKLNTPDAPDNVVAVNLAGAVEGVEKGVVRGWAMDRRRPFRRLDIDVYQDGRQIDRIKADRYRPDLRANGAGSGRYGFVYKPAVEAEDDSSHVFDFRFGDTSQQLPGSPCHISGSSFEPNEPDQTPETSMAQTVEESPGVGVDVSRLAAGIDFADGRRVTGWAVDRADTSRVLTLRFEVDGAYAGVAKADDPREDLSFAGVSGDHGFQVVLRTDVFNSPWQQMFRLDVRDQDSEEILIRGYPIHLQLGRSERENASFARRLQRLEQTLEELREQLPQVRRRTAYELGDYDLWYEEVHREARAGSALDGLGQLPEEPPSRISVVVPLSCEGTLLDLQLVLDSLRVQKKGHQFFIVNQSQSSQAFEVLAQSYIKRDKRFAWIDAHNQSVPAFLLSVLGHSAGEYIFLLHPGESLSPDALDWMAYAGNKSGARIIYADGDRIDGTGAHCAPDLRPDFNEELLLSTPYIGAYCVDRTLLESVASEVANEADDVWQYDLLLRIKERLEPGDWLHIARVLTHRNLSTDAPANNDEVLSRSLAVLQSHLTRSALPAQAEIQYELFDANPKLPRMACNFAARLKWSLPEPAPKVSIIVPTRDEQDLVRTCIESIQRHTNYPDFEILLMDHDTRDAEALRYFSSLESQDGIRVLRYTGGFNWSAINNLAVSNAEAEVVCFLNNDTEVFSSDWLTEMVSHACRQEIGAVGAKLLHRNGTLQHGGVLLGVHGVAEHAFTGLAATEPGYMIRAAVAQDLSAVTGACLVCRREVFESVGGFEMVNLGVAYNDVDFCLRLKEAGYRIVWTPHAQLYHLGSQTRSPDDAGTRRTRLDRETSYMRKRWANQIDRDPCYNPAFERHNHPYSTLTTAAYSPLGDRPT